MAIASASLVQDKKIRVLSVIDYNKFDELSCEEQEKLFGGAQRIVCCEAGISADWKQFATNTKTDLFCIDRFGESGPAQKVAEHLGFTQEKFAELLNQ